MAQTSEKEGARDKGGEGVEGGIGEGLGRDWGGEGA